MIDRSGCLKWEKRDRIGIIKIFGQQANTIPKPDFADIEVVKRWVEDEDVLGLIITGEGKHFCAGASMEQFERYNTYTKEAVEKFALGKDILKYIENAEKPVIASIDGACLGGGLEIALSCPIRYCSKNAIFGFPEINHGIIPALGGIERMLKTVGQSKTLEILLTGDTFGADEAKEIGFINRVFEEKSAFEESCKVLEGIISKGKKPVRYAIKSVNNSHSMETEKAMKEESKMFAELVINQFSNGDD